MSYRLWGAIQISTPNPLNPFKWTTEVSFLKIRLFCASNFRCSADDDWSTKPDGLRLWRIFSYFPETHHSHSYLNAEKNCVSVGFFFYTFLLRILIYLIQMTREIEVHEPLHSYNTGHVSEQYVGILQKIVYSNKKKNYCKWNELMFSKVILWRHCFSAMKRVDFQGEKKWL